MTILGEEWKEASAWHAEPCERLAFSDGRLSLHPVHLLFLKRLLISPNSA